MTFPIDRAKCPHRHWAPYAIAVMLLTATPGLAAADVGGSLTPRPWSWSIVYKADVLGAGSPRAIAAIDNLSTQVDLDGAALLGWNDTAIHGELLSNHGSKLNRRVGTTQGISNIEVAQNSARLYATWIEHQIEATKTRVLVGLYDLNSEFYATDASGLLIHPSFGIGIDFSQSGRNGPSIFPNLGLGVRIRQPMGRGGYLQVAAIDGVPGDPAHPGRTVVRLGRSDGALLVGEAGWQQPQDPGPGTGHLGLGVWQYTRPSDIVEGGPARKSEGIYVLAQGSLGRSGASRTIGFVRAGAANRDLNSVGLALDAGVLVAVPFGARGPRSISAGMAIARFSQPPAVADRTPLRSEMALEVDARWQLSAKLALQPLMQWVLHPGGSGGAAAIAGLRIEWLLEPK